MKALSFVFAFLCLSAHAEASRRFIEEDVVRRERIETVLPGPDGPAQKVQFEYLIMSNGSLWMRPIIEGNLVHMPTLVPLGWHIAQDFAPFAGRLFLMAKTSDPKQGRFLIELNATNPTPKPYAWVPETLAYMGVSGLGLWMGAQSAYTGHYAMAGVYAVATAFFAYKADEAAREKPKEKPVFFNAILRDEYGAPYRIIDIRINIFNGDIEEIYLQSTHKIMPVRMSHLFPNKNCNGDLKPVEAPPLSPQ